MDSSSSSSNKINVVKALRDYVDKMVKDIPGMKAMLLDQETTQYISLVYTQSEILQKEVYLIDRVESTKRENMQHLKAVVFVRPTEASIGHLVAELKSPKYGQYYLYFSNFVKKTHLTALAEADEHEVVREVTELYADYLAVNSGLFSLGVTGCMLAGAKETWEEQALTRSLEGLAAVLLSIKKKPVIRYAKMSGLAKKLATELSLTITNDSELWTFSRSDVPPLLLILDRRDDPVTPLLNQWTYQAMVHELLGIYNNRVNLSDVPNIKPEMKEVILNPEIDEFYKKNIYSNFGEIGQNIMLLVEEFQKNTNEQKKVETIEDMKSFIEKYPKFRQMSGNVAKHVSVVDELSRRVNLHDLMTTSEIEQNLACQNLDHSTALQDVKSVLDNPKVNDLDKLRVALLYALRYEKNSSASIPGLVDYLSRRGVHPDFVAILSAITQYSNSDLRGTDLFGTKSIASFTKKTFKGLKGVENIYTQHEPYIYELLDNLVKGKLKEQSYPFMSSPFRERPQDIIIFTIGGVTYEEVRSVDKFMRNNPGVRILLGGTAIHNAFSFMEEVEKDVFGPRHSIFEVRKLTGAKPEKTEVIHVKKEP